MSGIPPANTMQRISHVDSEEVGKLEIVLLIFLKEDAVENDPARIVNSPALTRTVGFIT